MECGIPNSTMVLALCSRKRMRIFHLALQLHDERVETSVRRHCAEPNVLLRNVSDHLVHVNVVQYLQVTRIIPFRGNTSVQDDGNRCVTILFRWGPPKLTTTLSLIGPKVAPTLFQIGIGINQS